MELSSSTPFAALTLRSLVNARGEFLLTTLPVADYNQAASGPIVFPQIADGGGYRTELILVSAGGAASDHLRSQSNREGAKPVHQQVVEMKKEYDFSKAKRNPYAGRLKRQITIRLDHETVGYFKQLADEIGIPYQTLINLYLRECAASRKKLTMRWRSVA